jgi:hypothetical protein
MRLSASRIRSINHRLARAQGLTRPGRDINPAAVRYASRSSVPPMRQPKTLKIVVVRNAVAA